MSAIVVTASCAADLHVDCDGDAWTLPGVEVMTCMCKCHETDAALMAQLGEAIDLAYALSDGTPEGAAAFLRGTFIKVGEEFRLIQDVVDDL